MEAESNQLDVDPETEISFGLPSKEIRSIQAMLYRRLAERTLTVDLLEKHRQLLDMDIKFVVCEICDHETPFELASYKDVDQTTDSDSEGSDDLDNPTTTNMLEGHVQNIRRGICDCRHDQTVFDTKVVVGRRLIHLAASDVGLLPVLVYLHGNGCQLNPLTLKHAYSPVFLAVYFNQPEVVKFLIPKGADVNLASADFGKPLGYAIHHDFDEVAKTLLTAKDIDINGCHLSQQPLLIHCVRLNPEYCDMLLEAGADPNIPGARGNTALVHAVNSSDADLVKLLIRYGADVNKPNNRNEVALLILIYREDANMARILLEAGADPNYITELDGNSLLILSAYSGNVELVNLLIRFGGSVSKVNNHGYSALHIAAWNGHLACVKSLLKAGAPHDNQTGDKNTPLSLAAHGGITEVMKLLMPLGCAVNNADKDLDTPLHYAAYNGMTEVVQLLMQYGANPNFCNRVNATALWNAVYMKHKDVVKLLLLANVKLEVSSKGINQHSQTNSVVLLYNTPMSPLRVAVDRECPEIALLLVTAGYDIYRETWLVDALVSDHSDKPILALLSKYVHTPPRLVSICRNYFRSFFGLNLMQAVNKLDIPGSLKNYLTLEDLKNAGSST